MNQKNNYYHTHALELKRELKETIDKETLKQLHKKTWWKHFFIVLRQLSIAILAGYGAWTLQPFWQWFICAVILGFIAFCWSVLLHEVVHKTIFEKKHPMWETALGYFYAVLGGLSQTQFTHWHLDHHSELGSFTADPKRAYLTPKIVKRWYKLLYMTPMLFPIYFRAAAKAAASYPREIQKKIKRERVCLIATHLAIMGVIFWALGVEGLIKLFIIPYFFIFPIVFTLNRLGQHYSIDPEDPAHWTSLINGHFFWDFAYIYSNYHLEHHYFPGIPCYNLPKLQKLLEPLYKKHQIEPQGYFSLLYHWIVKNQVPHTKWV